MSDLTQDELRALLAAVVQYSDLSKLPEGTRQALSDAGVISFDESHVAHIRYLTAIAEDLRHPRHAHDFFAKYDRLLPVIVAHDLLTTNTAMHLLLWSEGKLSSAQLGSIADIYRTNIQELMLDGN